MIALRLFSAADANRQIDMRVVAEREELTIGRDAAADWPLADPDRALSRLHLKVSLRDGVARVTDTSTNGVTLVGRDERLPRDAAVSVDLGERLEVGPYVILVERADGMAIPKPAAPRGNSSPFDSDEEAAAPAVKRRADPFASALPRDPLSGSLDRGGDAVGLGDEDAWSRSGNRRAGDWEGPAPIRDTADMIGASAAWREPPATEADERGFGFDTPFTRPMLRTAEVRADDLAIPSDWDAALAASAPAPQRSPLPDTLGAKSANVLAPRHPSSVERDEFQGGVEFVPLMAEAPSTSAPNGTPARTAASVTELGPSPPPEPVRAAPRTATPPSLPDLQQASASTLFEAFCTGAHLDPVGFATEDPAKLMERLGVVYRHMVLGLSDVMGERTALKSEYRMVRTSIRAEDNNPLKWAPPQKVASELLRASNDGFLAGPDAVTESFQDIKKHLLCMLAGLRAALSSTLDTLAPAKIEEALKDQSFVLKTRGALAWAEYAKVYAQLRKDAEDNADSPVNREFRAAYEKQLAELDRMALR